MSNYLQSLDDGALESDDDGYLVIQFILTYMSDTVGYDNSA